MKLTIVRPDGYGGFEPTGEVVDLRKGDQLGLFATTTHVKAHTRATTHGMELVKEHERHVEKAAEAPPAPPSAPSPAVVPAVAPPAPTSEVDQLAATWNRLYLGLPKTRDDMVAFSSELTARGRERLEALEREAVEPRHQRFRKRLHQVLERWRGAERWIRKENLHREDGAVQKIVTIGTRVRVSGPTYRGAKGVVIAATASKNLAEAAQRAVGTKAAMLVRIDPVGDEVVPSAEPVSEPPAPAVASTPSTAGGEQVVGTDAPPMLPPGAMVAVRIDPKLGAAEGKRLTGKFEDHIPLYRVVDSYEIDSLVAADAAIHPHDSLNINGGYWNVAAEREHGAAWGTDPTEIVKWGKYWSEGAKRLGTEQYLLDVDGKGHAFGHLEGLANYGEPNPGFRVSKRDVLASMGTPVMVDPRLFNTGLGANLRPPVAAVGVRRVNADGSLGPRRPLSELIDERRAKLTTDERRAIGDRANSVRLATRMAEDWFRVEHEARGWTDKEKRQRGKELLAQIKEIESLGHPAALYVTKASRQNIGQVLATNERERKEWGYKPLLKGSAGAIDVGPIPSWSFGAYTFKFRKGTRFGALTIEGGKLPMPYHMVAGNEAHARKLALEAVQAFEAGRVPREGVFRRELLKGGAFPRLQFGVRAQLKVRRG